MSGPSRVTKRTFGELLGGMFLPATPDQIEVITAMADMDLNQDQTGWNIHPQVLIGQLRKLNLAIFRWNF